MTRDAEIRVLTYNGHVGIPIRNGALQWLLRETDPDVILLQESIDTAAMRRALPLRDWHYHVEEQPGRQGTYVVARKDRFDLVRSSNRNVTFGEKHNRRRAVAVLRDRRTGREVVASSIHVAPLGAGFVDANPAARKRHERQVQTWADYFAKVSPEAVAIVGGDVNENIGESRSFPEPLRSRSAVGRLGKVGLRPASYVTRQDARLDDVFVRQGEHVKVTERRTLRPPVEGGDHPAVVVTVEVAKVEDPATFKAATWNVFYGTKAPELRPHLRRMREDGVTLFLLQELSTPEVREMIREEGLRLAFAPRQYGVAWDPEVWEQVGEPEAPVLSPTTYYTTGGHPMPSRAVRVVLRHRPSGKTIDALSYHTPSSVQTPAGPSDDVPRRVQALRESVATLKRLADENRADAVLYGGDDNVDERRGDRSAWDFMRRAATGLRQVIFPAGTHHARAIDDFRVRGLRVGDGYDVPNPSDHDAHVRVFTFRR